MGTGRAPRKPQGKALAVRPGSVDRVSMKKMSTKARLERLAVQQAGQAKVAKGHHRLSADTQYRRVGNRKLGGQSKKKIRQRAIRARNVEKACEEAAASTDVAMREDVDSMAG